MQGRVLEHSPLSNVNSKALTGSPFELNKVLGFETGAYFLQRVRLSAVMDVDDSFVCVQEDHIQRNKCIFHPGCDD